MPRGVVDLEGLRGPEAEALRRMAPAAGLPFKVTKIGHVVLKVTDLERSKTRAPTRPRGQDTTLHGPGKG